MNYVTTTSYRKAQPPRHGSRIIRWSREEDQFLKENCSSMTILECAQQLNRSFDSVNEHVRRLRKKGLEIRFIKSGENHFKSKYSAEDVELVRALVDAGLSVAESARKMDVPYATARSWVEYETRKLN